MPNPYTSEERHTGQDAIIKVANRELEVTNVSWDRTVNETEVQMNGSLWASRPTTGLRVSGSFEYDGANEEFRSTVWYTENDQDVKDGFHEAGEPKRLTMTVRETAPESGSTLPRTVTFTNMKVTGESRDNPADDVSGTSWDFVAEEVNVN